jgi:hypothetical protein
MMKILAKPWELLRALFVLAFPMFRGGGTGSAATGSPGVWVARGILLAVVLAGLGLLNQSETLGLKRWIPYGRVGEFWLPLFAFCAYAMIWLGWLLYRVLGIEVGPVTSEFQDIDRAWSEALEALAQADIHLADTPLFLVLGWTSGGEEFLFHAAALKAQVKQVPQDPSKPLHVTANRDGIWVSCPGASLSGQQSLALGGGAGRLAEATLATLSEEPADPFQTMGMGADKTLGVKDFMDSLKKTQAQQRSSQKQQQVIDTDKYLARLRYLCGLIARDRQGFCPVNGILVVLPITAADPTSSPDEIAATCKTDLAEAFEVFRMRCPVLVLISDLEKLQGFSDLVERLPAGQKSNRMGQRFPLAPDLDPSEVPARIEASVNWTGDILFPSMVQSLYQVESPGGEDVTEVIRANSQLYRFLAQIRERQESLARLVRDCVPDRPAGEPIMFGGCYFAGTGDDSATEQAFASGVLKRLIQDQDNVTWTSSAMDEDAAYLRLARGLKAFLISLVGLGIATILGLIGYEAWFRH